MAHFPALRDTFRAAFDELGSAPTVVVGHARPDGDCIGSQVALCRLLRAAGGDAVCVNTDTIPKRLEFLAEAGEFVSIDSIRGSGRQVAYVDCADEIRPTRRVLELLGHPVVQIDHHLSNARYATRHNLLDSTAAATAEILAGLAFDLGLSVDQRTAQALYAGILTDTGRFCFPSTTRRVLDLSGLLLERGASPSFVAGEVYERETPGRLSLLQHFLASFEYHAGGKVCLGTLPAGIFERTGTLPEDTEGLVDYARGIDGVEIGALIEERVDGVKGSLRSKSPAMRVDRIAALFNGGGHACAAGFKTNGTAAELRPILIAALEKALAQS